MKPAPFDYQRPGSLSEAVAAVSDYPDAKVLAGGQSLIPLLSMRLAAPGMLVDLSGLTEELAYVRCDDTGVRVGALATHTQVEQDVGARQQQPLLGAALRRVAHPTIRNRGTVVGSIAHADPAAEMPMVLCLVGGRVTAVSARGSREVEASEFFVGPLETSLAADEIATEAFFPALAPRAGAAFDELARRHGDYALVGVGAIVDVVADGSVAAAAAGYLSVADVPVRLDLTEAFGTGPPTTSDFDAAASHAVDQLSPESDLHASAGYRRQLASVLTARVLAWACQAAAPGDARGAA